MNELRAMYRKNAIGLREMLVKAESVAPRKYRGYTVAELRAIVARYEGMADGSIAPPESAVRWAKWPRFGEDWR